MLRAMNTPNDAPHYPAGTNQEPVSDHAASTWPFQKRDGYENPSLERYSDLRFEEHPRGHRKWAVAIAVVLVAIAAIIAGFMIAIYAQARSDETRKVDALLVLGAAQYNGRPTDVFEARLQHTLDLYNQGYAPYIIVTGGKMEGDQFTEGDTAATWLENRGVPTSAIIIENEGRDTWDTLEGAWVLSRPYDVHTILIVSDGFHLFRAERMANAVGFEAYSSAAPDSPIRPWSATEFSYVIRETGAVVLQIPKWLF
ncbi:MAG: YdcF family protein [Thermomicrobiales bacterium]|nr:YdcF family protein [Thermomicrobiales bacterium]